MTKEHGPGVSRAIEADRDSMDNDVTERPSPIPVLILVGATVILWAAKIPVVRASPEWSDWCSKPHGAFGSGAALLSTLLAIVFASQLFQFGYRIASGAAYQPLREDLESLLLTVRKSRVPLGIAVFASSTAAVVFIWLWSSGSTAFNSIGWFVSDIPTACACTFALSYLISCSAACVFAILRTGALDAGLNHLHAEPENSIRAVSGIVALALTRIVLAAFPLLFHPLMSSSYELARRIVSGGTAGLIILVVAVAYCAYVFRIRSSLVAAKREIREELHRRLQRTVSGSIVLDSREHIQLESLAILAEHARMQSLWPSELRGFVKVASALVVAIVPTAVLVAELVSTFLPREG